MYRLFRLHWRYQNLQNFIFSIAAALRPPTWEHRCSKLLLLQSPSACPSTVLPILSRPISRPNRIAMNTNMSGRSPLQTDIYESFGREWPGHRSWTSGVNLLLARTSPCYSEAASYDRFDTTLRRGPQHSKLAARGSSWTKIRLPSSLEATAGEQSGRQHGSNQQTECRF